MASLFQRHLTNKSTTRHYKCEVCYSFVTLLFFSSFCTYSFVTIDPHYFFYTFLCRLNLLPSVSFYSFHLFFALVLVPVLFYHIISKPLALPSFSITLSVSCLSFFFTNDTTTLFSSLSLYYIRLFCSLGPICHFCFVSKALNKNKNH